MTATNCIRSIPTFLIHIQVTRAKFQVPHINPGNEITTCTYTGINGSYNTEFYRILQKSFSVTSEARTLLCMSNFAKRYVEILTCGTCVREDPMLLAVTFRIAYLAIEINSKCFSSRNVTLRFSIELVIVTLTNANYLRLGLRL